MLIRINNSTQSHITLWIVKEAVPGEVLAGGHAGHLCEPGGQVGEGLEHGLQEGDQVHEPGWGRAPATPHSLILRTVDNKIWKIITTKQTCKFALKLIIPGPTAYVMLAEMSFLSPTARQQYHKNSDNFENFPTKNLQIFNWNQRRIRNPNKKKLTPSSNPRCNKAQYIRNKLSSRKKINISI